MQDKIVIITGTSSGIEKAHAFKFGWKVPKVALATRKMINSMAIETELQKPGV